MLIRTLRGITMKNINKHLKETLISNTVQNKKKLKHQQEYYRRLQKQGIAQKQTYNLKSTAAL